MPPPRLERELPFEEPRGELPEERLLLPEERVALDRGVLVGALNELLESPEPLERLLEFQVELLWFELFSLVDAACIQRF